MGTHSQTEPATLLRRLGASDVDSGVLAPPPVPDHPAGPADDQRARTAAGTGGWELVQPEPGSELAAEVAELDRFFAEFDRAFPPAAADARTGAAAAAEVPAGGPSEPASGGPPLSIHRTNYVRPCEQSTYPPHLGIAPLAPEVAETFKAWGEARGNSEGTIAHLAAVEHRRKGEARSARRALQSSRRRDAAVRDRLRLMLEAANRRLVAVAKLHGELESCSCDLEFHHYVDHPDGRVRLAAAQFCKQRFLCQPCAKRRAVKHCRAYAPQIARMVAQGFTPYFATFTQAVGADVGEQFRQITDHFARLMDRGRRAAAAGKLHPWARIEGALLSVEVKRSEGTRGGGLWHVHGHAVLLVRGQIEGGPLHAGEVDAVKAEWCREFPAVAAAQDVRLFHGHDEMLAAVNRQDWPACLESLGRDLVEVLKYPAKFESMGPADRLHVMETLRRKRLVRSYGQLFDQDVDESEPDEVLEGRYVRWFGTYVKGGGRYEVSGGELVRPAPSTPPADPAAEDGYYVHAAPLLAPRPVAPKLSAVPDWLVAMVRQREAVRRLQEQAGYESGEVLRPELADGEREGPSASSRGHRLAGSFGGPEDRAVPGPSVADVERDEWAAASRDHRPELADDERAGPPAAGPAPPSVFPTPPLSPA